MCVGWTNDHTDFASRKSDEAIYKMVPGSAISFNRIGFYHFAIFLGFALPKGGNSEPIPLLCHLSGDAKTAPKASVRLEDVRGIVQKSTIRVYHCHCNASKRAGVIWECLSRVGETGYSAVSNNCENFVRQVINGEDVSYQTLWTFLALPVQGTRLLVGGAIGSALSSSAASSCCSYSLGDNECLGLIDPEMDLLALSVSDGGLNVSVDVNTYCTKEFTGSNCVNGWNQEMYHCRSCGIEGTNVVCKYCMENCHQRCQTWGKQVCEGFCDCTNGEEESGSSSDSDTDEDSLLGMFQHLQITRTYRSTGRSSTVMHSYSYRSIVMHRRF